jgi:hypothetical protein
MGHAGMEEKSKNHQRRQQSSALAHRTKQELNDPPHLTVFTGKVVYLEVRGKFLISKKALGRGSHVLVDLLFFPPASM